MAWNQPSEGVARAVTRVSHLTERAPIQPGTTTRRGAPWTGGSGAPFIAQASSTSGASARSRGMDTSYGWGGSADGETSGAWKAMWAASGRDRPGRGRR